MWETIKNAGILMAVIIFAFMMGILVASFIFQRRMQKSFVKKKKVTGFMPDIQEELWEIVIQASLEDFRFQAMLGYDSELMDVLTEPILMDSKYLEEGPLLPGEIALVVVNDKQEFIRKWQDKNEKFTEKVKKLEIESCMLFLNLYKDFNESLNTQSEDNVLYFLYLRTPKTMCIVVLNMTFNKVLAVSPILPELHSHILDLSGSTVVRASEDFEKLREIALNSSSKI
ncbi:MAG: hypothetical protein K8S87_11915 [Planctomycetes bacterium]|nr:hypothetical protein [Planctomycetota bacterium]